VAGAKISGRSGEQRIVDERHFLFVFGNATLKNTILCHQEEYTPNALLCSPFRPAS
jgi:hypothetical protein